MSEAESEREISKAVQKLIDTLIEFDNESKSRILSTVNTFFGLSPGRARTLSSHNLTREEVQPSMRFSERDEVSPKEFLFQKQPATDVERIACLAYYLTHYRDTPHFKTFDISKLNTEAAQAKFSNAAYAVTNAANTGLLVPAGKGQKQLSAMGERYVEALPNKSAAKEVKSSSRGRKRNKGAKKRQ